MLMSSETQRQMSAPPQTRQSAVLRCPSTGLTVNDVIEWRWVRGNDEATIWWRCPSCEGWHVVFRQLSTVNRS